MATKISFIWFFMLSGILLGVSADLRGRRPRGARSTTSRAPRTPRSVQEVPVASGDVPQLVESEPLLVEQKDAPFEAEPPSSDDAVGRTSDDVDGPGTKSSDGLDGDAIVGGIDIEANPGEAGQVNGATSTALDAGGNPVDLQRKTLKPLGTLPRRCQCAGSETLDASDIRSMSDSWMGGGTAADNKGFSNMLWSFGQFIDHDIVGTIEDLEGPSYTIEMTHNDQTGSMVVHRLDAPPDENGCPAPKNVHTAAIDAGPVYGTDATYLNMILRQPNSCKLRESESQLLPITSSADDKGRFFFIAGDVRADEHGLLTCMHTVWMREHNRLCDEIAASESALSPDEQFSLARKVVAAKLQQITMKEFLPALGITQANLQSAPDPPYDSEFVSVEFATAAFRFGHDLVPDFIGPEFKTTDIFNGEDFFLEHRDGGFAMRDDAGTRLNSLLEAAAANPCARRDGMMSDTLRNTLFGNFGHDLAARNIFRARDMRMPSYEDLATCFGAKPVPEIASMVNDAFIGMLQEPDYNERSIIGGTTRKIFLEQFKAIFFGPNGSWWRDNLEELGSFADEVAGTSLGIVIQTNTGADVPNDVFHTGSNAQSPSTA